MNTLSEDRRPPTQTDKSAQDYSAMQNKDINYQTDQADTRIFSKANKHKHNVTKIKVTPIRPKKNFKEDGIVNTSTNKSFKKLMANLNNTNNFIETTAKKGATQAFPQSEKATRFSLNNSQMTN